MRDKYKLDSGSCVECDWVGLLKDVEIEYEYDEFKGIDVPYTIYPESVIVH